MGRKIVVGLSGGVDSAVCAGLLTRAGFEVTGLYLDIGLGGREAAQAVAKALDIGFESIDIRPMLEEKVVRPFVSEYLSARTPNPCIVCNPTVKFPALLEAADRIGAKCVATGHYARIDGGDLKQGHPNRDQSYMLYRLTDEQRVRVQFPLGEYDKPQVRALAKSWGLAVAGTPDSMEICFIPGGNFAGFIETRTEPPAAGDFVSSEGVVLGRHNGIHRYTVGQRKGLGISAPAPLYVTAIRPETNEVVLSSDSAVYLREIRIEDCVWHKAWGDKTRRRASVRVRHSKTEQTATVTRTDTGALVIFDTSARAPTPGQSAVFYDGDTVLGGGIIT